MIWTRSQRDQLSQLKYPQPCWKPQTLVGWALQHPLQQECMTEHANHPAEQRGGPESGSPRRARGLLCAGGTMLATVHAITPRPHWEPQMPIPASVTLPLGCRAHGPSHCPTSLLLTAPHYPGSSSVKPTSKPGTLLALCPTSLPFTPRQVSVTLRGLQ